MGLNQQISNLRSRCLGDLFIYSARGAVFVTRFSKCSCKGGESFRERCPHGERKENSALLDPIVGVA